MKDEVLLYLLSLKQEFEQTGKIPKKDLKSLIDYSIYWYGLSKDNVDLLLEMPSEYRN